MRNRVIGIAACSALVSQVAIAREAPIQHFDAVSILDHVSLGTHAPEGWALDSASAQNMGTCAIYKVKEFDLGSSPAIIHPKIADKTYQGDPGIETLVQESAKRYSSKSPDFKLEKMAPYPSRNGHQFQIWNFVNGPKPNHFESVAYFSFKSHVFILAYSARTKKDFQKYEKDFHRFLEKVAPNSSDISALSGKCLYPAAP